MTAPVSLAVTRRNPFAVTHLPLIARLYRAAYSKRRRFSKRFVGKPAKKLFRLAYHGLGLGGDGEMTLTVDGTTRGLTFNARNTQFHALYLPQYAGGYEAETTCLIDAVLPDDGVFYDIGANWGFFALFAASRPGFRGRVHAFEPLPATYADLDSLVTQAGLRNTITCHQMAASDKESAGSMVVEDGLHSGIARLRAGGDGVSVPLRRLDDLDLPPPAVMKIDVEGHEAEALTGASRLLETIRPLVVFESWCEPRNPDITFEPFRVLAEKDYVFFQPAWARDATGYHYGVMEEPPAAAAVQNLILLPFLPEQRFLLGDQMNVFACPRERISSF